MRKVLIAKVKDSPSILTGVLQIEDKKVSRQSLLKRLVDIQSVMPCKFIKQFLAAFRDWESLKAGKLVASVQKFENYVPIFERLRGLPIWISHVYLSMERAIAPLLTEEEREDYINNLLLIAMKQDTKLDSEFKLHDLERLYGNSHYSVDWTDYDSFIVKDHPRIICIFSTIVRKDELTLAAIGFHDDAYLTNRYKLKFDRFSAVDTKKIEVEQNKLDKVKQKKEKEEERKQQKRRKRDNWVQPFKGLNNLMYNKNRSK